MAVGAALGLLVPAAASPLESAIDPVLGTLLYATFLGVPFARLRRASRDLRFLGTVLMVNFVVAPLAVFAVSRVVAAEPVLFAGVLFVLLTPCIDYVIVFTGLAGGAEDRLLAAAPLLMIVQMLLLPLYLWLMAGPELVTTIDVAPFARALLTLILLPLGAAWLTQFVAARHRPGRVLENVVLGAMVPLMMLTLAVVVASQVHEVGQEIASLVRVVPVYVVFAMTMAAAGVLAGRLARLDIPGQRAILFSGVTRNSLVILPLVLALPARFALAPLVVVTQTLVELIIMVVFVRLVPRLVPMPGAGSGREREQNR